MIKKAVGILLAMITIVGFAFNSFASENDPTNLYVGGSRILKNESESTGYAKQTKGQYISSGFIRISDEGKGSIGVFMKTFAHQEVDESNFIIYLDELAEDGQRWITVADYEFNFSKKDYPNESLATKSVSFTIPDQPIGKSYRLRGVHIVVVNRVRETISSNTDGITLKK